MGNMLCFQVREQRPKDSSSSTSSQGISSCLHPGAALQLTEGKSKIRFAGNALSRTHRPLDEDRHCFLTGVVTVGKPAPKYLSVTKTLDPCFLKGYLFRWQTSAGKIKPSGRAPEPFSAVFWRESIPSFSPWVNTLCKTSLDGFAGWQITAPCTWSQPPPSGSPAGVAPHEAALLNNGSAWGFAGRTHCSAVTEQRKKVQRGGIASGKAFAWLILAPLDALLTFPNVRPFALCPHAEGCELWGEERAPLAPCLRGRAFHPCCDPHQLCIP